jgi:hypothetical protein
MANPIGGLQIDVIANIAGLVSDLGKAQTENAKAARAMRQQWSDFGDGVKSTFAEIASMVGIGFSVDGIVQFTRAALQAAEQVDHLSQSLGANAQTVQTLSFAAGISGSQLDVMTGALEKLEKAGEQAVAGSAQQTEAFRAIGISATQLAVLLKDPDQLIQVVTQHLSEFKDGSAKTAVTMELMGRGAAQNTPLINKLGESFGDLKDKATQLGVVLSEQDTQALADAQGGINLLGEEVKGLSNQFSVALLPTINKITQAFSDWLQSDAAKSGIKVLAEDIAAVVDVLLELPADIRDAASEFDSFAKQILGVDDALEKFLKIAPQVKNDSTGLFDFGGKDGLLPGVAEARSFLAWLNSPTAGSDLAGKMSQGATSPQINIAKQLGSDMLGAIPNIDQFGSHIEIAGVKVGQAGKKQLDYDAAIKSSQGTTEHLTEELMQWSQFMDGLNAKLGDISDRSLADFNKSIDEADSRIVKMLGNGLSLAEAIQMDADATDAATAAMYKSIAADVSKNDVADDMIQRLMDEGAQLQALTTAQQAQLQVQQLANKALETNHDLFGQQFESFDEAKKAIDLETPSLVANTQALLDQNQAIKLGQEAAKQWVSIWQNAGDQLADTFSKILVEGGSLFDGLKSLAQQTVEAIISYFEKLAIINPILNSIFGGSSGLSLLPTLAGAFGGGGAGSAGGISSLLNWATDAGGTEGATAAGNASLFGTAEGGASLFNAGKTMFSGFSSGLSNLFLGSSAGGSSIFGTAIGGDFGSTFAPSALGYGAAGVGGLYAGYNEFQNAGGGVAGLAGGAAYGVGTAAIGLGVASAATGGGLIAGLSVLGPVGWAAIALMAVDMISGGKLFGTKGKFNFGESAITVGSSGATVSQGYDLKGQSALFGGSTHSWQTLPTDPAAQAAADQFFAQLTNSTDSFAKQFGVKMGDIVGGQFIATFDKKGNITKTSDTVLGQTYADTQQQFEERLNAENMLAVLGTFDKGLDAAVNQFRANADQLLAVTQALAQGETMMQGGTTFLALGTDQSLSSLLKLAEGSQQFGESIDQTLARIEQAQAQYDQFVAQFKPATNYVDDFEKSLSDINAAMLANIKQANALAVAAGAAGASEKDLADIHAYAAKQAAAAITALEASAQSLAFSLGLTTVGSLDQVNQEIAALQAKAGQGGSAIQNFGNAIQQVSQKAVDAMNLLLGDLSPLNDQQKLQAALQGLRAGTATQDEVLQIGRRLYASSQQYVDLFNMVKSMGGAGAGATSGGGGGGHAGGLSAADSKRLADLLKEQQQLQASAQLQQYQTLAQQVAEIASAKGEDWQQVLKDMNVNIADFEKGLGLNDQQTGDYITAIQKQTDSAGDNTQSIIAVLNQILTALGGTPSAAPTGSAPPSTPPGHAGTRSGMTVQQFVDQVVGGLQRQGARNLRQNARA